MGRPLPWGGGPLFQSSRSELGFARGGRWSLSAVSTHSQSRGYQAWHHITSLQVMGSSCIMPRSGPTAPPPSLPLPPLQACRHPHPTPRPPCPCQAHLHAVLWQAPGRGAVRHGAVEVVAAVAAGHEHVTVGRQRRRRVVHARDGRARQPGEARAQGGVRVVQHRPEGGVVRLAGAARRAVAGDAHLRGAVCVCVCGVSRSLRRGWAGRRACLKAVRRGGGAAGRGCWTSDDEYSYAKQYNDAGQHRRPAVPAMLPAAPPTHRGWVKLDPRGNHPPFGFGFRTWVC